MTATINQCLAQLKSSMEAAWVTGSGGDGSVDAIYDYRTFPDKLRRVISLSYQGGVPAHKTISTDGLDIVIAAVLGVQIIPDADGNIGETELRTADQTINTMESQLFTLLGHGGAANRNSYWMGVQFNQSVRPPSPVEAPTTRYGEVVFTLKLK